MYAQIAELCKTFSSSQLYFFMLCFLLFLLQMQDSPRTFEDVDVDVDDHVNYTLENSDTFQNLALNWIHSEQYVDVPMKSDEELMTNTAKSPLNEGTPNPNTTYEITDDGTTDDTFMAFNLKNETCVGEPEYCNYTEHEYRQMVYDYLFPTAGEWVLIGCHAIVFLVGLVSLLAVVLFCFLFF